jgi:branched-chain amino acid transport system permease protein
MAEDAPIAAAFGVNQNALGLMLAGLRRAGRRGGRVPGAGVTLRPRRSIAWIGVVFAAVMLGGLGSALGPLIAGCIIGVSEAVTMAVASPSWAPIVSFSLLMLMLLLRPGRVA